MSESPQAMINQATTAATRARRLANDLDLLQVDLRHNQRRLAKRSESDASILADQLVSLARQLTFYFGRPNPVEVRTSGHEADLHSDQRGDSGDLHANTAKLV